MDFKTWLASTRGAEHTAADGDALSVAAPVYAALLQLHEVRTHTANAQRHAARNGSQDLERFYSGEVAAYTHAIALVLDALSKVEP